VIVVVADWLTEYLRRRAKIFILTFFTYAALC
jgi:hypothetical protein